MVVVAYVVKLISHIPCNNSRDRREFFNYLIVKHILYQNILEVIGNKPLVKINKINPNKKLIALDLGCGSGELAIQLAPYFKKIIGIDLFEKYLLTAKKDAQSKKILNFKFIKADAKKLPFKNNVFYIIYCSRGPLSQNLKILSESLRVLKKGGTMIEETIGERDKLELKRIFNRGQNYPICQARSDFIKKLLLKAKVKLIFLKSFIFWQNFSNTEAVVELLERAPIIPEFDIKKDREAIIKTQDQLTTKNGIILSSHRLCWAAKKL